MKYIFSLVNHWFNLWKLDWFRFRECKDTLFESNKFLFSFKQIISLNQKKSFKQIIFFDSIKSFFSVFTLNSVIRNLWFSVFVGTYLYIESKVLDTGLLNFHHLFFVILLIFLNMESTLAKKLTTIFCLYFGIFLFIFFTLFVTFSVILSYVQYLKSCYTL